MRISIYIPVSVAVCCVLGLHAAHGTTTPTQFQVRLMNGSTRNEGRVDVFYNGAWTAICDKEWDERDARVVCRELSYRGVTMVTLGSYSSSLNSTHVGYFRCHGNETKLSQCPHTINEHDWEYWNETAQAGVTCRTNSTDDKDLPKIQLTGPPSREGAGLVAVYIDGQWGRVCDSMWDRFAAEVVCRQLGFPGAEESTFRDYNFGGDSGPSGPALMTSVQCIGEEQSLFHCRHRGKQFATCDRTWPPHIAGVICRLNKPNVRLVGSPVTHAGIVQIRHGGLWGTICMRNLGLPQAHAVCRELGFRRALFTADAGELFHGQTGPVWLTGVTCVGNESSILHCDLKYSEEGRPYPCYHLYDSGIICESNKSSGFNGTAEIRLQGGKSSFMGRVEIYLEGFWGALCSVGWDKNDSDVVCRQLGYPGAVIDVGHGEFGSTSPVWLTSVGCQGNETSLDQCLPAEWIHEPECWEKHGAGVICKMDNITGDGNVRLLGADEQNAGRVEVQLAGIWGGVSDEDWDLRDGHVVCRQLGYLRAAHVFSHSRYGRGNETTWLTGLQCTGEERNILDCPRQLSSRTGAYFRHKAAVQCTNETHFTSAVEVRLIGMNLSNAGHVQVRYNGTWGTICARNRAFNYRRATVICRQLHMGPPAKHTFINNECTAVNQGAETVWLSDLNCQGFEESIDQCPHRGWGRLDPELCRGCTAKLCSMCLICQPASLNTSDFTVRLAGSNRLPYAGRVEVRHAGIWGVICPRHINGTVYKVICRQLGFDDVMGDGKFYGPKYPRKQLYGEAKGPVWLSKVRCHGNESHLSQCEIDNPGEPLWCEALELMCLPRNFTPAYPIRLAGASVLHAGRLEMFYNGSWGTVCGYWTVQSTNAMIACRQLGFGLPLRSSNSWLDNCPSRDEASGPIWLTNVKCRGNESSLDQCLHKGQGPSTCGHTRDACLVCDNSQYHDTEIAVQLIGSQVPYAGRVKVRYQGVWGTLCKDDWKTETAEVLCRQLGYKGVELDITMQNKRENSPYAIYDVGPGPVWFRGDSCYGNEKTLSECALRQELSCLDELVQLVCRVDNVSFTDFPVKLSGSKPDEGRVEVFYGGLWGSVSAVQWDIRDAMVLCRQLGYANNNVSTYYRMPEQKRVIWFQKFNCRGDEQSLGQCAHSLLAKSLHPFHVYASDVFVRCANDSVIATEGPSPSTQVLRASPTSSHVTPAISPVTTPASSLHRDSDEPESGGKHRSTLIVLGVLLGVVCLMAIVAVVLYIRKRNRKTLSLTEEKKSGEEDGHIQLVSL